MDYHLEHALAEIKAKHDQWIVAHAQMIEEVRATRRELEEFKRDVMLLGMQIEQFCKEKEGASE